MSKPRNLDSRLNKCHRTRPNKAMRDFVEFLKNADEVRLDDEVIHRKPTDKPERSV